MSNPARSLSVMPADVDTVIFTTRRHGYALSLAAIGALLSSPLALAAPERYELDPEHATVAFLVEHVGYARTLGRFTSSSGSFVWDGDTRTLSELVVTVDTASVATDHKARDKHVRSKDFLSVKKHPTMVFEMDGDQVIPEGPATVAGQLTLRGESRPLMLAVTLNKSDKYPFGHKKQTLGVSVAGTLARSDYGMSYGVANGLVGDDVDLIIEVEANRE